MTFNRRLFLKGAGAAALSSAVTTGIPSAITAHAADTSGYKALVCVFLLGGIDNHDVLLPYDQSSYDSFASIRQELLSNSLLNRDRGQLLPLNPGNAADFGTRQFALPPELPRLKALFDSGDAAIISNVGPLIEPTNRQQFSDESVLLPPRLFSHNDQQATWQASAPEGAQLGWGGLFADAALAAGANAGGTEFTTIAAQNVGPFLTGEVASPYQVGLEGSPRINLLNDFLNGDSDPALNAFYAEVENQFRAAQFAGNNILSRDIATKFQEGLDANKRYDAALSGAATFSTVFPASPLGQQLEAVARTISIRGGLFASRQIFFTGTGGFDTHSNQADDLPGLLSSIDGAVDAFQQAMAELGLADSVTLFTASDFGRTLSVNGDGTDHGWGGNHFVVGGAVQGGSIYGAVPPMDFGHDADAGLGRLIPTMSVEEFAAPLGRWWGLNDTELAAALPNLRNFDQSTPAFV